MDHIPARPRTSPWGLARLIATLLSGLVITLAAAMPAVAHVDLIASTPGADSTLTDPPVEIVLTFSDALDPDGVPGVRVTDPVGDDLTSAPATKAGAVVRVPLNLAVNPGSYVVDWVIVAPDGDEQRGTYAFTYRPSEVEPAMPTPAPTTPSATSSAAAPTTEPTPPEATTPASSPAAGSSSSELETTSPQTTDTASTEPASPASVTGGAALALGLVVVVAGVAILALRRRDPLGPEPPDKNA